MEFCRTFKLKDSPPPPGRPMTPPCVSSPFKQRPICMRLQSIILQGFASKDLQSWIPRSSVELRPSSAPPSPFHTPPGSLTFLGLHSTTSIGSQGGKTHLILSLRRSFKLSQHSCPPPGSEHQRY
ncbi:hypothetical protein ATANTOWER_010018 [Ataeniobius toweri]|uniref:Uncharacterized protein n=1 Tax=Ataeniobius toweri TaxID=208326 RepID=A0ABU7BNR0_9TELE|nr:hypothetical protein [Ataeniobius toweri]